MRILRAVWNFVRIFVVGTWRFLKGIYQRLVALVEGILGPPAAAFLRLLRAAVRHLDRWMDAFLAAWARIFQQAPKTPRDRRRTPGREIIPLAATIPTLLWWYVVPWENWFTVPPDRFPMAVYATAVGVAVLIRWLMRGTPPGPFGRFLVVAANRAGLIWFERLALVATLGVFGFFVNDPLVRPAAVLTGLGFLVLVMARYEPRRLRDDLPEIEPVEGTQPEGTTALHSFRWSLPWAGGRDDLNITVVVDVDTYDQVRSVNPGKPSDPADPDFTPWVVEGATAEVDRAAAAIRRIANERAYSRFQEAAAVLGFAQSVEYTLDEDSTGQAEYWRFPVETIHDETGDCEDTTILAAAVLRRLGHRVLPLLAPGHAALGVVAPPDLPGTFVEYDGVRYYYCETTAAGFRIGELPSDIQPSDLRPAPLRESV